MQRPMRLHMHECNVCDYTDDGDETRIVDGFTSGRSSSSSRELKGHRISSLAIYILFACVCVLCSFWNI